MGRRVREESDCNVVVEGRSMKLLRGGREGHDCGSGNWRTVLEKLHLFLDHETEGDALAWLEKGTHFMVQQTREEDDHGNYTIYSHECFVLGKPEKIEQILSHKMPRVSTNQDVVMPSVAYSSALKPLEVRLSLPDTRSQSWEVTIAPSVLPRPTFDAADVFYYHESSSADNSCDEWSDHDMNSPLWWSQRSDFSSTCTNDLSDMDTLSQISAYYA